MPPYCSTGYASGCNARDTPRSTTFADCSPSPSEPTRPRANAGTTSARCGGPTAPTSGRGDPWPTSGRATGTLYLIFPRRRKIRRCVIQVLLCRRRQPHFELEFESPDREHVHHRQARKTLLTRRHDRWDRDGMRSEAEVHFRRRALQCERSHRNVLGGIDEPHAFLVADQFG